jgi:drug/metabolite transporter (DMT)-like permease
MREQKIYFITGITAAFLFGLATPISKILLNNLNPFLLAGLLYLGGAIGLSPLLLKKRNLKNEKSTIRILIEFKRERMKIIGSVIFGGILGPLLLLFGLLNVKAGSVSIWLNFELVATAILGRLFFNDTLERNAITGIICMIGAGIVIAFNESLSSFISIIIVILACFCWGLDNQLTGLIEMINPTNATFIKGIGAGTINTIIGLILLHTSIQFREIILTLLLGAAAYGLSIVLYIITAQQIGSTRSQILFSGAPIIGVFLSFLFLKEIFQFIHIISISLVILGIYFSNRASHAHIHIHQRISHSHRHSHSDGHHDHQHDQIELFKSVHIHEHSHSEITHEHVHYPDLHHRHEEK